jgi:iron complex outermembrane receptor protein
MDQRFNKRLTTVVFSLILAIPAMHSPVAFGQGADATGELEEIIVTARKREENLSDLPVALTAFTRQEIESAGMTSLLDVVEFTPGVQFENNSVSNPGRFYTDIRFRGLGNELVEPFAQVGSVFLDGIQVVGGASSIGTENIERIEIVKGPSSALFGRSTFAGAVNYISKTPSLTESSGRVTAGVAQDNTSHLTMAYESPFGNGKYAYRVFAQNYDTGGQYTSADGGALGEQNTRTYMATLYGEPTDSFSIKLRAMYSEDADGPPAEVHIGNASNRRGAGENLANCFATDPSLATALKRNVPGTNLTDFFCGAVPHTDVLDSNTQITTDDVLRYFDLVDVDSDYPNINELGLRREQTRLALFLDWDIGEYLLSSVSSFDDELVNSIRDLDAASSLNWINYDQFRNRSVFQEFRLTSPADRRFTWMLGASYFNGEAFGYFLNGGESVVAEDGGMTAPNSFTLDDLFGRVPDGTCPCGFDGFNAPPVNENETLGVFVALGFDLGESFHIDFEGRFQNDDLTQRDVRRTTISPTAMPFATGKGTELGAEFDTFLPRLTFQYRSGDNSNLWATYSEGNNPGFFNSRFAALTPAEIALNPEIIANASLFLDEEELENIELGWRYTTSGGRANFSAVIYSMKWTNQKTREGILVLQTDGTVDVDSSAVQGFNTDLQGLEFEGSAQLTDSFAVRGQFTYSDAKYQNFNCGFTDDFAPSDANGVLVCDGNTPLQFPDWSGSVSLLLNGQLGSSNSDYFARLDGIYTGKQFTDEQNFSYIDSAWKVNLRGGVQKDNVRFEVYVTNLFDDDEYLAGGRTSDFSADTGFIFPFEFSDNQSLGLVPANRRQVGVSISVDF